MMQCSDCPHALWAARYAIRDAYTRIRRLRQADPTIRNTLNRLDDLCAEPVFRGDARYIAPHTELQQFDHRSVI